MSSSQRGREPGPGGRALTRRQVLAGSLAGTLGLGLAARRACPQPRPALPNIVFVLADDI